MTPFSQESVDTIVPRSEAHPQKGLEGGLAAAALATISERSFIGKRWASGACAVRVWPECYSVCGVCVCVPRNCVNCGLP